MKQHQGEGGRVRGGCFWKAVRSNAVLVVIPCKATMEKQITTEKNDILFLFLDERALHSIYLFRCTEDGFQSSQIHPTLI